MVLPGRNSAKNENQMFVIEDEIHAEPSREVFPSRDEAMAELKRLATVPCNEEPNRAPCIGWKTCGDDTN